MLNRTAKLSLIFAIFILQLIVYGFDFGTNTYQAQDLPFIYKIQDPSLYPDDPYVSTLKNFPSYYCLLMAQFDRFFDLENVYLVFFLVLRFALLLIVYELTILLFQNARAAFLAIFIYSISPLISLYGLLGESPFMINNLYHGSFSAPLTLLVIYLFLKQEYIWSLAILAAIFYLNPLAALHVAVLCIFGSLGLPRDRYSINTGKLLWGWGILGVITLPFLFGQLASVSNTSDPVQLAQFLKNWYPSHYFLSSWDLSKWLKISGYLLLLFIALNQRPVEKRHGKMLRSFMVGVLAMWVMAYFFAEVCLWRTGIIAQFFRSDIYLIALGIICAANLIDKLLSRRTLPDLIIAILFVTIFTDLGIYLHPHLLILLSVLLGFYFLSNKLPSTRPLYITYLILLNIYHALMLGSLSFNTIQSVLIVLLLAILMLGELLHFRHALKFSFHLALTLVMLIALIPYVPIMLFRIKTHSLMYAYPVEISWDDMQRWVEKNTPQDAKLIVPPYFNGFRTFSKRTTFIERLDGGIVHWQADFGDEWLKRISDLGYRTVISLDYSRFNEGSLKNLATEAIYGRNNEDNFKRIAELYHYTQVVTQTDHSLNFPLLYQNDHFRLYALPPARQGNQ